MKRCFLKYLLRNAGPCKKPLFNATSTEESKSLPRYLNYSMLYCSAGVSFLKFLFLECGRFLAVTGPPNVSSRRSPDVPELLGSQPEVKTIELEPEIIAVEVRSVKSAKLAFCGTNPIFRQYFEM